MKKIVIPVLIACATMSAVGSLTSCKGNDPEPPKTCDTCGSVVTVSGDISSNTTWDASKKYVLKGFVYVTNGATLTVPAGTVIMGDKATKGTLVITRGSKIMAEGTAAKPIIFTSVQSAGARREGDWGGLIILGKSTVNPSGGEAKIEGGLVPTSGGDEKKYIWYGGTETNDNSGTLKYVRIEFAGIAFSPDNEVNGLTMGGVGAGTTISYVQVYRSGDDAFEWFGGTVNCDHLMATYSWDDDFDTDFGYSGRVQFGVAQRVPSIADVSTSNGFESDNDGNGSANMPQTKAIFANMTIIGPIRTNPASGTANVNSSFGNGAQIRRNSSISIINSVITGFPYGLYIDDSKGLSSDDADNGSLMFKNNIIATPGTGRFRFAASWANANTWFAGTATDTSSNPTYVGMVDPYKFAPAFGTSAAGTLGRPNYLLSGTSPALAGALQGVPSGIQQVTYRGAFDASNDWTSGWSTFDAENNQY